MITVLLVRHADIDLPPVSPDPSLNESGKARAAYLAYLAEAAGVTAIFTSEVERTKQTAAPLGVRLGLVPRVVPEMDLFADEARAGSYGAVVLLVGHSNTVPALITALTKEPASITIGEKEFDNLFVVSLTPAEAQVLRLKYGPAQV